MLYNFFLFNKLVVKSQYFYFDAANVDAVTQWYFLGFVHLGVILHASLNSPGIRMIGPIGV